AILLVPALLIAKPVDRRRLLVFIAAPLIALAPFVAFCLATVGSPLPATAAAKVQGGLLGRLAGVAEPARVTFVERPSTFLRAWVWWLATTHWLLPLALAVALVVV